VLPYNDLVRWVIESVNITDRDFFTADGSMFKAFKPEDVKKMYHFSDSQWHYNKAFLEAFTKKNDLDSNTIK